MHRSLACGWNYRKFSEWGSPGSPAWSPIGHDRDDALLRGFAASGLTVTREAFAFRTDDLIAYWEAVRAGLGVGFEADYLARTDTQLVPVLSMLKIPPLPIWLAVHREIRTSPRIRAVYDFLASTVPEAL